MFGAVVEVSCHSDAIGGVLCLKSQEVSSIPDADKRGLLETYLIAQSTPVRRVFRLSADFFLIPPGNDDCKRCLFKIVVVSEGRVIESVSIEGTGAV
jgi:hypothetical protein